MSILLFSSITAGPVFDDELWKLRQEVNRLKETLAMQSAYVQSMPKPQGVTSAHASTGMGPSQVNNIRCIFSSSFFFISPLPVCKTEADYSFLLLASVRLSHIGFPRLFSQFNVLNIKYSHQLMRVPVGDRYCLCNTFRMLVRDRSHC